MTALAPFQDSRPADAGFRELRDGEGNCAICNRPVRHTPRRVWLHVIGGGGRFQRKGEAYISDGGELGWWPVGSNCAKKYAREIAALETRTSAEVAELEGQPW